uniref:Nonmuscle myosin heavy chain b n=1 Tax=Psilocybe cubensis TaxID=181762 RepID=A0A8H8CJM1_PSICU
MPAPRLSQNAEAARAAAQQAEFNEKKWVWVPDIREGYLAGWVNKEEEDSAEVIMAAGGEFRKVRFEELFKMNPPKFDRVEDIADLTFLNEASVVHNLRLRYGSGAIYTYSGLFLVAINPYQHLPLYSDAIIQQYRGKRRDENPPHVFAVAERAWVNMGDERENQSILITGESGAGKTESTKKVIQYLAAIATDVHQPPVQSHSRSNTITSIPTSGLPRSRSMRHGHSASVASITGPGSILTAKGRLGLLERQILQANPILEAFGNAQTQRNNNSSRFGKFVRIMFAPDGSIAGANIDWYLLEKSRVVFRNEAERSFHVFYQLMAGGGDLKGQLLLDGQVEDYEYLNKSRREVDGVDDLEDWNALVSALNIVGFDQSEQIDLFRIVAAILHIGNITITATRSDDASMPDPSQAERVCHLLGIPIAEFTRAVLRPRALAGREWVTQARTRQQAVDELSALCKTLYEKSFGALVERINRALDRPSSKATFIGVLDIAGFEIFEVNGYEQLLINYTNEKLQQFFNHHMFVLEQEEYAREGIHWDYVNFGLDLQPTIDLIESSGNTIGILSFLDEECIMPKADDRTFTNKLNAMWTSRDQDEDESHPGKLKYEPSRFEQGFIIQHYAAKVEYRTDGWLEKNKDPLNDNLTRVLAASSERYVASLFAEYADQPSPLSAGAHVSTVGRKRPMKKGAFRTVAQRHKEQLSSLMAQLRATQPHFVRCIVPNNIKKPGRMDVPLVLDQLRCNGVLEGIRIARLGYPNRLPFVEFRQRYEILTPGILPKGYMDGREACRRMVNSLELDDTIFKLGTSKIFFKAGVLAELEERRDMLLFDIFSRLQAVARMWTARRQMKKILNRAMAVKTIQRNAKVRPLLAATRNDEELRKKELELALIKERAERDKQEKQALEKLKMTLEAEKRKVEADLEAERSLALDKDALLERSKRREGELEEEIGALQADINTLDSQLTRAMRLQKESEDKYEKLREAFDQAAEHLVRLEQGEHTWSTREAELNEELRKANEEIEALQSDLEGIHEVSEELRNLALQREEDLARTKERMDSAVNDLRAKLETEARNKDLIKDKADHFENEARQTKEQLSEMGRTATEYSTMIQKKEDQIVELVAQLEELKQEHDNASMEIVELRADIDTIDAQLSAEKKDHAADLAAKHKLQAEMDELRDLLATKTTEATRRSEAEKSKELELVDLRGQCNILHQELAELRRSSVENQNKLKVELEQITREHTSLQHSHTSLLERERAAQSMLTRVHAQLSELEKGKRALDSELLAVKSRQTEVQDQLAEALRVKENLERQLTAAQDKYRNFEDVVLDFQREQESRTKELDTVRKQLETEIAKRTQLEKTVSTQKAEVIKLKDRNTKLEKDLNTTIRELKDRQFEVKQLESKQDKTIVEHVYVLEEAKRVTDRQLQEARSELEKQAAHIKSLQMARKQWGQDIDDINHQHAKEIRAKEQEAKLHEKRADEQAALFEKEMRAKQEAELQVHRVQTELDKTRQREQDLNEQLIAAQRSKAALEGELDRLAADAETGDSLAKLQRDYETRIAQLEAQLEESELARATSTRIQDQIERQHAEIRELVLSSNPTDRNFHSTLLHQFELAENAMKKELSVKSKKPRLSGANELRPSSANSTPRKASSRGGSRFEDAARASEKQVAALKQQLQLLEVQMAASERVRRHLESSVHDLTVELSKSDGSKQFLEHYRAHLVSENEKLTQLLKEEAEARRTAEAARIDGVQTIWAKFQQTIADERENYARLEESRKALLVQQRTGQDELETQRTQIRDLTAAKNQLMNEVAQLREQHEISKMDAINAKRQLQKHMQDEEVAQSSSNAAQAELKVVIEALRANEHELQARYEAAEMERVKAVSSEHQTRRQLNEAQVALTKASEDHKKSIKSRERRIQALEAELAKEGRESSETSQLRQRLSEELEDEREQHRKDLAERDFTIDQTRKKYQAELAQLSEELQAQRDGLSRLRDENRKLRSDHDALQLKYDDEVYNSKEWKKDKERMEEKVKNIESAYEASTAAQAEQQSQIVALHGQLRELRGVLDDAENERSLLQKARRALQAELETIKLDYVDSNKMSSDPEFQRLQLKKQDLERSLEEQEDRVSSATERLRKAESLASEYKLQLDKVQDANAKLDQRNASLEKQNKELNVRIVDLETRSYASSPRAAPGSRRMESRIEELTNQLQQSNKDRRESGRLKRTPDKSQEAKPQPGDSDRQKAKLEAYEMQIEGMRQSMDAMQTAENKLQAEKRRAERDASDYKQKVLSMERELERLRARLEGPIAPERTGGGTFIGPRK